MFGKFEGTSGKFNALLSSGSDTQLWVAELYDFGSNLYFFLRHCTSWNFEEKHASLVVCVYKPLGIFLGILKQKQ
jgi:hypothetical protein